ncbi:hypothetical protein G6F62_014905 [Rhizopus arrhizus]|nr:hypothetical protein G6F62_014905 [Rhizopus arrhizus]
MPGASPRKPPRRAGLERPKPRRGGASGQMAAAAAARAGLTGRPSPPRTRCCRCRYAPAASPHRPSCSWTARG